jgi:hypothetical protein
VDHHGVLDRRHVLVGAARHPEAEHRHRVPPAEARTQGAEVAERRADARIYGLV